MFSIFMKTILFICKYNYIIEQHRCAVCIHSLPHLCKCQKKGWTNAYYSCRGTCSFSVGISRYLNRFCLYDGFFLQDFMRLEKLTACCCGWMLWCTCWSRHRRHYRVQRRQFSWLPRNSPTARGLNTGQGRCRSWWFTLRMLNVLTITRLWSWLSWIHFTWNRTEQERRADHGNSGWGSGR